MYSCVGIKWLQEEILQTYYRLLFFIQEFADNTVDVWDHSNIDRLNLLKEEVPALFEILNGIMEFEQSCQSLPLDVADLVRHVHF